jgi:hypothetical protein
MVKTDMFDTLEMGKDTTELLSRDQMVDKIQSMLTQPPLNMGKNDYCFVRIVGNHLEIGRAKIVIEE